MSAKPAGELLVGDTILETVTTVVKGKVRTRTAQYLVRSVQTSACSVHKTHVTVDNSRHWCYDSAQEVDYV